MRKMNFSQRKILVVHSGGIGDLILATPALKALRQTLPKSEIHFFGNPMSVEVLKRNQCIDKIITFDTAMIKNSLMRGNLLVLREVISLLRRLRAEQYDASIILQPQLSLLAAVRMATFCFLIAVKERIGRDTGGRGFFLTKKFYESPSSQTHEIERMLKLAEMIGSDADEIAPQVNVSETDRVNVRKLLKSKDICGGNPMICFAPGFGKPTRAWYPKNWAHLADRVVDELKAKVVIIGGAKEVNLAADIISLMRTEAQSLAGETSLMETAALLEMCDLLVTNDSGPMHLASAVGCNIVALFGPGDYNRIRPYGPPDRWRVLRKMVPCAPCYKQICNDHRCMRLITVEDVFSTIKDILNH